LSEDITMGKRFGLQRVLTLSASIVWGTRELLALQRVYLSVRLARLKSSWV
jgi:hypothetical protein